MLYDITLPEAVALGTAVSILLSIIWILTSFGLGLQVRGPLIAFFTMAAPILIFIAAVDILPLIQSPYAEGDAQYWLYDLTLQKAIAIGTAISILFSIVWIIVCFILRLSTDGPLRAFFLVTAPVLLFIAVVEIAPIAQAPPQDLTSEPEEIEPL